jgi:hypothetical protein
MLTGNSKRIAEQSKRLYEEKLRPSLESNHWGKFVCIEPESTDYFLGETFDEAVNKAIDAHPDRLTHTLRIGFPATLHLGVLTQ